MLGDGSVAIDAFDGSVDGGHGTNEVINVGRHAAGAVAVNVDRKRVAVKGGKGVGVGCGRV